MLYIPYPFKRCSTCGNTFRPTFEFFHRKKKRGVYRLSSQCRSCENEKMRRRYADHPDRMKAYQKVYRAENPEKVKTRKHMYYIRNAKEINAKAKAYNRNNVDKVRSRVSAYGKDYRTRNPQKGRASSQRYRARKNQLPATFNEIDWQYCLDYFDNRCAVCGRPPGLWHKLAQDHWIPVAKGGEYTPHNIVPLCHGIDGCNNSKCDQDADDWLIGKYGKRKAKEIARRVQDYFASLE